MHTHAQVSGREAGHRLYDAEIAGHSVRDRPGGVLFALDQRSTGGQRTRHDHRQERHLADGRTYEIVKLYYTRPRLEALFAEHGFRVEVTTTPCLWVAVARLDQHAGGAGSGAKG